MRKIHTLRLKKFAKPNIGRINITLAREKIPIRIHFHKANGGYSYYHIKSLKKRK
jgi:hypothetical protein